jgi:hypothetical protein
MRVMWQSCGYYTKQDETTWTLTAIFARIVPTLQGAKPVDKTLSFLVAKKHVTNVQSVERPLPPAPACRSIVQRLATRFAGRH